MEFLPEGVGEFRPHSFRAGNGHAHGGQVLALQAPDVFPHESWRTDDQRDAILPAEFANGTRLQRVGVKNHAEPGDGGQPQSHREAERVKEGQNPQQAIVPVHVDRLEHAVHVGDDVAVGQHHALGRPRGAAGEDHGGQRVQRHFPWNQGSAQKPSRHQASG